MVGTVTPDAFEVLIREVEGRITKRLETLEEKVDKATEFQTIFTGATRIVMYVVIVLGGLAAIYAGFHGGPG